jgi:hypothetical protein
MEDRLVPAVLNGSLALPQIGASTTANQMYVQSLYETLLNRPADAAAAAAWTNVLDRGFSPMFVAQAIESSPEYRVDQVEALYERYLHRPADAGGLMGFVNFVGRGGTYEQVAAMLVGSPEYFQLHGGTAFGFAQGLFEDALHRPADAGTQVAIAQVLAAGQSRQAVGMMVFASLEYRADLVQSDYQLALGRSATFMEQAGVIGALGAGFTDQQVLAALLGSAEAFAKRA